MRTTVQIGIGMAALGMMAAHWSFGATEQGNRASVRQQDDLLLARSARFAFHSDFRMNLHDYLYFVSRRDTTRGVGVVDRCERPVSAADGRQWLRSVQLYTDSLSRLGGFDRPMIDIRYALSGVPGHGMTTPPWVDRALEAAEAVYRSCAWDGQVERNRAWANDVAPLVSRFEERIVPRLEELYRAKWEDDPIRVDLVTYVSPQGANTVVNPSHIMISTFDADLKGYSGLEIVFHESSHVLIGPRSGPIAEALNAAASELGTTPPRDLWHVVLFYTTGMAVRDVLRAEAGIDYQPYLYSTGLFDRAWPELKEAVEAHWTPYVEGRRGYEEAARALVAAAADLRR